MSGGAKALKGQESPRKGAFMPGRRLTTQGQDGGKMMILRVQDLEGRGPYRPFFTQKWADPHHLDTAPWWVEIGETLEEAYKRFNDPGMHYGCGFENKVQFHNWFNEKERSALNRLGYRLVTLFPDQIVVRTKTQIVFGSKTPLKLAARRISLISKLVA